MKYLIAACAVMTSLIATTAEAQYSPNANSSIGGRAGIATLAQATTPSDAFAYQAIQKGRWEEAERALRSGLTQNPNDPMRLLNLAYVLQSTGRRDEAASVYEKVLQLDRDPLVAVGPDSKVRPARAKIVARKGMAALENGKPGVTEKR